MQRTEPGVSAYHVVHHVYDASRSAIWYEICRSLKPFVAENAAVLDLGAGYGDFLRHVTAAKKYGLDINAALVDDWPEDVQPIIQSALDHLPLDDASIDLVFASNFFEHFCIKDCREILAAAYRVLKPGGFLTVIQPNMRLQPGRYYDDYTHKTAFTEISFGNFLESLGWCIVKCQRRFLPFTVKSCMPKWRWLVRLYLALPFRPFAGQFLVVAKKPIDA